MKSHHAAAVILRVAILLDALIGRDAAVICFTTHNPAVRRHHIRAVPSIIIEATLTQQLSDCRADASHQGVLLGNCCLG